MTEPEGVVEPEFSSNTIIIFGATSGKRPVISGSANGGSSGNLGEAGGRNATCLKGGNSALALLDELREAGLQAKLERDEHYGNYLLIKLQGPASAALDLWKKLAPISKSAGIWIGVDWEGPDDVPKKEMIKEMVEIMLASGFGPATKNLDALKLVREIRR